MTVGNDYATLAGENLTSVDFTDTDLINADLTGAILINANLTGVDLTGANLSNANLSNADLTDAILTGAILTDAFYNQNTLGLTEEHKDGMIESFSYADWTNKDLTGANLTDAHLADADLTGANLTGANLTGAVLTYATLAGADLTDAILTGADLTYATLTDADLTGANLTGADLTYATLAGANLTGAFYNQNTLGLTEEHKHYMIESFSGVDLTNNDFTGADLTDANFTGANLTGAILTDANLTSANLTGANLTGADLTYATLAGANLTGADLTGADLTDADLTDADLTSAKYNSNTKGLTDLQKSNMTEIEPEPENNIIAILNNKYVIWNHYPSDRTIYEELEEATSEGYSKLDSLPSSATSYDGINIDDIMSEISGDGIKLICFVKSDNTYLVVYNDVDNDNSLKIVDNPDSDTLDDNSLFMNEVEIGGNTYYLLKNKSKPASLIVEPITKNIHEDTAVTITLAATFTPAVP